MEKVNNGFYKQSHALLQVSVKGSLIEVFDHYSLINYTWDSIPESCVFLGLSYSDKKVQDFVKEHQQN